MMKRFEKVFTKMQKASLLTPSRRPKAGAEVSRRQAGCGVARWPERCRGNSGSHLATGEDFDAVLFIGLEDPPQRIHRRRDKRGNFVSV